MGTTVLKKRVFIRVGIPALALVAIGAIVLPGGADAATTDTAAASVDKDVALVGETVTFTSTNPCTALCALTWYRPDIGLTRFGGVIVGQGPQMTISFDAPGTYPVVLDLAEHCAGTTRLVCHSAALLYVEVVADPAAPPPETLPPETLPPETLPPVIDTTTLPADTTTTLPPDTTTTLPADTTTTLPTDTTTTLPADTTTLPPDTTTVDVTPPVVVPSSLVASNDLVASTVEGRVRLTWTNPDSSATSLAIERCRDTDCTDFRSLAVLDASTTSFI
jgi:hypothetical protein